jgi:hypothetical protein
MYDLDKHIGMTNVKEVEVCRKHFFGTHTVGDRLSSNHIFEAEYKLIKAL